MSLDITFLEMRPTSVGGSNYTHNAIPMWRKAGVYEALYNSHGRPASDIIAALRAGVEAMEGDRTGFEALNPDNGWGDYSTALNFLQEVLSAAVENPEAQIEVSA